MRLGLAALSVGVSLLAGCRAKNPVPCATTFTLSVNPREGAADHAMGVPGNQQVFQAMSATEKVGGDCGSVGSAKPVRASWTTSDPVNVRLDEAPAQEPGEMATCLNATSKPVVITANYTRGTDLKTVTARLMCK